MTAYNVKAHPAFAGYDLPEAKGAFGRLAQRFATWSAERRAYNEAFFELSQLSDRDLADIGVARADIPSVARAAAKSQSAR